MLCDLFTFDLTLLRATIKEVASYWWHFHLCIIIIFDADLHKDWSYGNLTWLKMKLRGAPRLSPGWPQSWDRWLWHVSFSICLCMSEEAFSFAYHNSNEEKVYFSQCNLMLWRCAYKLEKSCQEEGCGLDVGITLWLLMRPSSATNARWVNEWMKEEAMTAYEQKQI